MSISGQELIQIGAQNTPTMSDSLWTAFNKTQNNFTKLFSQASTYNTFTGGDGALVTANAQSGTVTIKNTGVLNLFPGTGISLSGANGNVVISASGSGAGAGVTSVGLVSTTMAISNSPIVSAGDIAINLPAQNNVVPGQYLAPTLTVDQYGRITDIANTVSSGTVTSVALIGGAGIEISGGPIVSSGAIIVNNSGVTKINAGAGISISSETGIVTVSLTNPGTGSSSLAAGSEGEIQFNSGGDFFATANLAFNPVGNILTVDSIDATVDIITDNLTTYDYVSVGTFMQLTPTTEPIGPSAGMVYYDSVMDKLRLYNGTSWGNISIT